MDPTTQATVDSRVQHSICARCQEPISRRFLAGAPGAWLHNHLHGRHEATPNLPSTGTYPGFAPPVDLLTDDELAAEILALAPPPVPGPPSREQGGDPRCDCGYEVNYHNQLCTRCAAQNRAEVEEVSW
jgi:hypothetical protein